MKTAHPPMPPEIKEVYWDFDLTEEEKLLDQQAYNRMPNSWPEREAHKAILQQAAKNTLARLERERSAISIKVPKVTLEKFKKAAAHEGLRYQTYLNKLIHLAAEGRLKQL